MKRRSDPDEEAKGSCTDPRPPENKKIRKKNTERKGFTRRNVEGHAPYATGEASGGVAHQKER